MPPKDKRAPALRIKFAAESAGLISGLGSLFGNVDSHGDIVEPGAFAKSLSQHRATKTAPLMLWQHNADEPIGRWIEFEETREGLALRGQINLGSSRGRDAWAHIEAGDVDGLSIGYREVRARPDGPYRRIDEVDLLEVSVVSFPANRGARIHLASKRELEDALIKSGLSREAASRVARGGWPALAGDDAEVQTRNVNEAAARIERLAEAMRISR